MTYEEAVAKHKSADVAYAAALKKHKEASRAHMAQEITSEEYLVVRREFEAAKEAECAAAMNIPEAPEADEDSNQMELFS